MLARRPERDEAAEYYFRYIDAVPEGDIRDTLVAQRQELRQVFDAVPPERAGLSYEPGKWTLREVVGHLSDTERLFSSRALWFARGLEGALPSFDQEVAIAAAGFDSRSWQSLVDEMDAVRAASIALFADLPADAWDRRGIASGNPFSVRALAWLTAGHVTHHLRIVRARYLKA